MFDLKHFVDFYKCYILPSPQNPPPKQLVLLEIFTHPSNNSVIYRVELSGVTKGNRWV